MDIHFLGVGKPLLTVPQVDLHVLIDRGDQTHLSTSDSGLRNRSTMHTQPECQGSRRRETTSLLDGAPPSQTLARLPFLHSFRRMTPAFLDPKGTKNKAARTNYIPSPLFGTFSRASQHTWSDSLRSRPCFLSLPMGVVPTTHPSHS